MKGPESAMIEVHELPAPVRGLAVASFGMSFFALLVFWWIPFGFLLSAVPPPASGVLSILLGVRTGPAGFTTPRRHRPFRHRRDHRPVGHQAVALAVRGVLSRTRRRPAVVPGPKDTDPMAQVFHRSMNSVARIIVFGLPLLFAGSVLGGTIIYRSGYITGRERSRSISRSRSATRTTSAQLGIDCRYCHTSVETSAFAGIPPTKTCMNCHQQIWPGADMLEPVRESYKTNKPIPWKRVHNLPRLRVLQPLDPRRQGRRAAYSCHGDVDQMNLTYQDKPLLMEWCIEVPPQAGDEPAAEGRGVQHDLAAASTTTNPETGKPWTQRGAGRELKDKHKVRDAVTLTSCSMCHR